MEFIILGKTMTTNSVKSIMYAMGFFMNEAMLSVGFGCGRQGNSGDVMVVVSCGGVVWWWCGGVLYLKIADLCVRHQIERVARRLLRRPGIPVLEAPDLALRFRRQVDLHLRVERVGGGCWCWRGDGGACATKAAPRETRRRLRSPAKTWPRRSARRASTRPASRRGT